MQAIDEPKVHVHDLHPNGRPGNVGPGGSNPVSLQQHHRISLSVTKATS
jgi:hypothetical protein